jgi:hypothetical protein
LKSLEMLRRVTGQIYPDVSNHLISSIFKKMGCFTLNMTEIIPPETSQDIYSETARNHPCTLESSITIPQENLKCTLISRSNSLPTKIRSEIYVKVKVKVK